ncbi:MAG: SMC-Scp complex subunit ScpB, partial [Planctomycetota bacterium]
MLPTTWHRRIPLTAARAALAGGAATTEIAPAPTRSTRRPYAVTLPGDPLREKQAPPANRGDSTSVPASSIQEEDPVQRLRRTEAVLLLAKGPVPSRKLASLAGLADATEARTLARKLGNQYQQWGRAMAVEEVAGGFQLLTMAQFEPWLRRLGHIYQ